MLGTLVCAAVWTGKWTTSARARAAIRSKAVRGFGGFVGKSLRRIRRNTGNHVPRARRTRRMPRRGFGAAGFAAAPEETAPGGVAAAIVAAATTAIAATFVATAWGFPAASSYTPHWTFR